MTDFRSTPCTAFDGMCRLSSGSLADVALAVKTASESGVMGPILIFEDASGRLVDLDLCGTDTDIIERSSSPPANIRESGPRGRGRPKLGVVAREITLLPQHWEWLAVQPGGASVALRKLVENACRTGGAKQQTRAAQEAAYRFMSAMAGDLPGFEEASCALLAGDRVKFERLTAEWPEDVRAYATRLAFGDHDDNTA